MQNVHMTTYSVLSSLDDLTPCHRRETNRAMYTLGFKFALFISGDVQLSFSFVRAPTE